MHRSPVIGMFRLDGNALYEYVDEGWLSLHQCTSPSDVLGRPFTQFLLPTEIDRGQLLLKSVLRGESVQPAEFTRKGPGGPVGVGLMALQSVVLPGGRVAGITGVCVEAAGEQLASHSEPYRLQRVQDQQMIEQLHDTNERLQSVVNTIEEDINLISLDGDVLWHNKGRSSHIFSPPGAKCWKFFEGREDRCSHCVHPDILRDGKPRSYECHLGAGTATPTDWRVRAAPLRNKQGEIYAILESAIDITERKRIDAELQKIQKLQSLGTLAGGIAHDFNNIMMGLYGNIELAKYELPPDHPGIKTLEDAEKSMERAVRLTQQLLTFSKGGDPVKANVSLGVLVEETARFDLAGSDVILVPQQGVGLWMSKVDKGQIDQVISNLTINARQAMPGGGNLYITLENKTIAQDDIPNLMPGNYIKMSVRDEGVGIDPKHIERIFDPYFTTKHVGHGLGLATSYSIIKKHGGHIGVQSEVGKETIFTVYLPAAESQSPAQAKPLVGAVTGVKTAPKVLILDDEEYIRIVGSRWLQRAGCIVETASHGQQAIDMYKRAHNSPQPFDLMILDLTIPGGLGGQEVFAEILALDPDVKAIVSSGYSESSAMVKYAACGFKGAIAKPYTERELLDILNQALN